MQGKLAPLWGKGKGKPLTAPMQNCASATLELPLGLPDILIPLSWIRAPSIPFREKEAAQVFRSKQRPEIAVMVAGEKGQLLLQSSSLPTVTQTLLFFWGIVVKT